MPPNAGFRLSGGLNAIVSVCPTMPFGAFIASGGAGVAGRAAARTAPAAGGQAEGGSGERSHTCGDAASLPAAVSSFWADGRPKDVRRGSLVVAHYATSKLSGVLGNFGMPGAHNAAGRDHGIRVIARSWVGSIGFRLCQSSTRELPSTVEILAC